MLAVAKLDLVLFVDPSVVDVCAPVTESNQAMHYRDHVVATNEKQMQLKRRENLHQTFKPKTLYLQIRKGGEKQSIS